VTWELTEQEPALTTVTRNAQVCQLKRPTQQQQLKKRKAFEVTQNENGPELHGCPLSKAEFGHHYCQQ
jgi:hypothetical protein